MTQVLSDLYQKEHEILQTLLMYKTMESIMVNNNQGLVEKVSLKLWETRTYNIGPRLEYQDLLQWGNMGLIRAVQKFDASKGT